MRWLIATAILTSCGSVSSDPDAAQNAVDADLICDPDQDGLIEVLSCITAPAYIRFLHAMPSPETYSIRVAGAPNAFVSGLAAGAATVIGPIQAGHLDLRFVGPRTIAGQLDTAADGHYTMIAYFDPATSSYTTAYAQHRPFACDPPDVTIQLAQFTTYSPNPVPMIYSTTGGAPWNATFFGAPTGEFVSPGCWYAGMPYTYGSGGTISTPQTIYTTMQFASGDNFQLVFTDLEILRIDPTDRVEFFVKTN